MDCTQHMEECHHTGMAGWQVASRGIQLALNNRVEDAIKLLKTESNCIHRQAGYCYLTFIVSMTYMIIVQILIINMNVDEYS